jgi:hypothetical protein
MKVKRIVVDIETQDIAAAKRFYQDVLGLDLLMDHGWIATYGSREQMSVQISFASQGGSGTPTPDLSIEVDDLDAALERMRKARQHPCSCMTTTQRSRPKRDRVAGQRREPSCASRQSFRRHDCHQISGDQVAVVSRCLG